MSNLTPLQAVQEAFALIELVGQFFIVNRDEVHELQHGERHIAIKYYKDKDLN